mmetsp:Transcript_9786/g.38210  ORF Transcript_9786/g.38210 Transcript_9786/m.38210 type:complete len:203 (+) Transcript_9786:1317-1925(+)
MYTNTDTRRWYRRAPAELAGATACEYHRETTETSSETKRSCARDAFVAAASSPKMEKSVTIGSIPPADESSSAVSISRVLRARSSHNPTRPGGDPSLQCFVANIEYTSSSARNVALTSLGSTSSVFLCSRMASSSVCSAANSARDAAPTPKRASSTLTSKPPNLRSTSGRSLTFRNPSPPTSGPHANGPALRSTNDALPWPT